MVAIKKHSGAFRAALGRAWGFLGREVKAAPMPGPGRQPLLWLLVLIFCLVYLPYAFIMLEDTGVLTALEVDPGSIMRAINDLFKWPFYNMHNGYHSRFYGWTYLALNFFALLPVKLFTLITGHGDPVLISLTIRLLLFVIGLASILACYLVVRTLTKSNLLAFLGGLLLMFSSVTALYYTFVHPETTGGLFSLLGVYALLRFIKVDTADQREGWYILGLTALVLSALSKQAFFITALPVLFLFVTFYLQGTGQKLWPFLKSAAFWRYFLFTCTLSLLLLVLVHPYALIQPHKFFNAQFSTWFDHTSTAMTVPAGTAFAIWWEKIFLAAPLVMATVVSAPLALLVCLKSRTVSRTTKILYVTNLLGIAFITLVITYVARLFPGVITYLYPVYPFIILHIGGTLLFLMQNMKPGIVRAGALGAMGYLLILSIGVDISRLMPFLQGRMEYKETVTYQVYDYIRSALPAGTKIAHDHFTAVPETGAYQSCHYWNKCSERDRIEIFAPDYIIFNRDYLHNDIIPDATRNFLDHVEAHDFTEIENISGPIIMGSPITITVFKRKGL